MPPVNKPTKSEQKKYRKKSIELAKWIIRNHPDIPGCERCGKEHGKMDGSHIIPVDFAQTAASLDNLQKLCSHCHRLGADSVHNHPIAFIHWLDDYAPGLRENLYRRAQSTENVDWHEVHRRLIETKKMLGGKQ